MNWIVRANDFKQNPINGTAEVCSKKTLLIQALKKVGLFLGLAVASLFIPLLHFILVPAFLLLGALAFKNQMSNTHHFKLATYPCPTCGKANSISDLYFHEDAKLGCTSCSARLAIIQT